MANSRLPPKANAKAMAIEDAAMAAQAMTNATTRMISDLRETIGHNPEKETECEAEIARLRDRLETQQNRHRSLAEISGSIRRYLELLPPSALIEVAPRMKVKLKEGESLKKALDRIRSDIAEKQRERQQVMRAELPIIDRKRAARAFVNELATKGAPQIVANHEQFKVTFSPQSFTTATDIPAVLAWLNPELFRERLCAQIDAMPKPTNALSTDDKRGRLKELKAQVYQLELQEEALIEKATDDGFEIARRADASPQAILGIIVNRKARVAA
jgi:hypothetical protein